MVMSEEEAGGRGGGRRRRRPDGDRKTKPNKAMWEKNTKNRAVLSFVLNMLVITCVVSGIVCI